MEQTSTLDLGREAAGDFARLVHDELVLARNELDDQLTSVRAAALVGGAGVVVASAGATLLLQAFAVRWPRNAAWFGALLLGGGVLLGLGARQGMPRKLFARTRARVATDARLAKEAVQ